MVCVWYKKIWSVCLFEESHCSPALLKVPIYYTELVVVIFVWKVSEMHFWNARKHLQPAHSFMVNVLIWKFDSSNCSYLLSEVNFWKSNCTHLHLQGWFWEQLLSPKGCSFGVLIAWIFFRATLVFGNSYC